MTNDLTELTRRQAEAQATADAAALELAREQERLATEQAQRRTEWDRGLVGEYSSRLRTLEAEQDQAKRAFRDAVLADPVVAAWVEMRAKRYERDGLQTLMADSLTRLGREQEAARYQGLGYAEPQLWNDAQDTADAEALFVAQERTSALHDQREDYARGEQP